MEHLTFALIHSPLVGPLTWQLVQHEMALHGFSAISPILTDDPTLTRSFWEQHAETAAKSINQVPPDRHIVLVAHSGAGALLPAVRQAILNPVHAYVFVDAGIPRHNLSRLELMRLQDPHWADELRKSLEQGERFPAWSEEDLREVIPDQGLRRKMVKEIHARDLAFFSEPIPVFSGWPDAPCAFIKFSEPYNWDFEQARQSGWLVRAIQAGHFHMLVDPVAVMRAIVEVVQAVSDSIL